MSSGHSLKFPLLGWGRGAEGQSAPILLGLSGLLLPCDLGQMEMGAFSPPLPPSLDLRLHLLSARSPPSVPAALHPHLGSGGGR